MGVVETITRNQNPKLKPQIFRAFLLNSKQLRQEFWAPSWVTMREWQTVHQCSSSSYGVQLLHSNPASILSHQRHGSLGIDVLALGVEWSTLPTPVRAPGSRVFPSAEKRRGGIHPTVCCRVALAKGRDVILSNKKVPTNHAPTKPKRRKHDSRRATDEIDIGTGVWRMYQIEVRVEQDLGKDDFTVFDALLEAIAASLQIPADRLPRCAFSIVRKSFDARQEPPTFVYTVDMHVDVLVKLWPGSKQFLSRIKPKAGKREFCETSRTPTDLMSRIHQGMQTQDTHSDELRMHDPGLLQSRITSSNQASTQPRKPRVVVVGSGPAGLFAALTLAECNVEVILVERGQPVQGRGRDIGALMVRSILNPESNLCFGEGGAGTWSDGKLTTRTGKNGVNVQTVLATLVRFGAPAHILIDGKPHVGTDKLIHILRAFRLHLQDLGVKIMFGTKMEDLVVRNGRTVGIKVTSINQSLGQPAALLEADAVVLGVGHSARDVYEQLLSHNILLTPKDFAVGFRVEHPQELINEMQYRKWAAEVQRGRGKVPVADYKVAANLAHSACEEKSSRGCYSFCMCPGGQVVPTSTIETELCINGMSFSNRSSKWANAAIVVSVAANECKAFVSETDPLPTVAFQRRIEQEAACRGGGHLVAPAQTVPDFLDDVLSGNQLPSSSYRLGVRAAPLHDMLPPHLTEALKEGLALFDRQMPGFIDKRGLLHGVETRTSSPLRIDRHETTFQCISMQGLYPIGEGAGYAGGIVSAAVDGMHAGIALARQLYPTSLHLQNLVI